jgi:hypothetical protein
MATGRQIRANRDNARKSTGPKTPEGKRICSKNAALHAFIRRCGPLASAAHLGHSNRRFQREMARTAESAITVPPTYPPLQLTTATWDDDFKRQANSEAGFSPAPETDLPDNA